MFEEYAGLGIMVMEVNGAITDQAGLVDWTFDSDNKVDFTYPSFRIDPAAQVTNDYNASGFPVAPPVFVIIDLTTMKVINGNCGTTWEGGEQCIKDNM